VGKRTFGSGESLGHGEKLWAEVARNNQKKEADPKVGPLLKNLSCK
jgi:hypothetical protein